MTEQAVTGDGLYLHVPFCERKCLYCDFYSIESGSLMTRFLDALRTEIALQDRGRDARFGTIFLGGGTPSLLSPSQLERVLVTLNAEFRIGPGAEVTVEVNPGTVDAAKLAAYRALGVNRLSIGIQSFDPAELEFLTRIHDREEAIGCVQATGAAGFENFSIDLMYALPGQTWEQWRRTLEQALALDPPHISAYGLIVEDGTPLAKMVASGQVSPAPAEREAELYERTMAMLEAHGYEHYEVSNYARPGFRSRHNENYWKHGRYLGFGPSAHSFWHSGPGAGGGERWWNIRDLTEYLRRLERGEMPVGAGEALGTDALLTERVFLGLRSDGVDLDLLEQSFGPGFERSSAGLIAGLVGEGLVVQEGRKLRLTQRGFPLCDEIALRLLDGVSLSFGVRHPLTPERP